MAGEYALLRGRGRRTCNRGHNARRTLLDGEPGSRLSKFRAGSVEGDRSREPEQRGNLRRGYSHRATGGRTEHIPPCGRPINLTASPLIILQRETRLFDVATENLRQALGGFRFTGADFGILAEHMKLNLAFDNFYQ